MDAIAAYVSIVGLVCNFVQERRAGQAGSYEQFRSWLASHRHDEIVDLIARTNGLSQEIDQLLRRNHLELLVKVDQVSNLLTALLSQIEGFNGMAKALSPGCALSDDAKRILVHFHKSGELLLIWHGHGLQLSESGELIPFNPKFVEDDLRQLLSVGLLVVKNSDDGCTTYNMTRAGADYADLLKTDVAQNLPSAM